MATTPNYGWVTPAPTDFVTDLPADFETFADAVDGDLAGLLGGTTGQILTKDSNTDHDFSWQSPSGAGGLTLLSTTTLTGASTTISGISGSYKQLFILMEDFYPATDDSMDWRINGNTGSVYYPSNFTSNPFNTSTQSGTKMTLVSDVNNASSVRNVGIIELYNYTSGQNKLGNQYTWAQEQSAGTTINRSPSNFLIGDTNAITSITFLTRTGVNLGGGTIKIYGVN